MGYVPEWSWDPAIPELPYLPVETVPARVEIKGVLTCEKLFLPTTHYVYDRTLPCLGDGCGACSMQLPKRPEAFCSFVSFSSRRHVILRLTKFAAITVLRCPLAVQSVRGLVVKLKRRGQNKNGFLACEVDPVAWEGGRLPDAPKLALHLSRVWRLDGWVPKVGLEQYAEQVVAHNLRLIEKGGDSDAA